MIEAAILVMRRVLLAETTDVVQQIDQKRVDISIGQMRLLTLCQ